MPSTYSPALRLELIGNGEQASNWGNTTNTNLGTLLEQAITGYKEITLTAASTTLLASTGASDDARNAVLMFSGSPGATASVIVPTSNKFYAIKNNTGALLTIKTSAGSGPVITQGYTQLMYCNGTDVIPATVQFNSSNSNITTPGTIIASTALYSYGLLTVSGNITGYSNATISGTLQVSGTAQVTQNLNIGNYEPGSKNVAFHNSSRGVTLYLGASGVEFGLDDASGAFRRFYSNNLGDFFVNGTLYQGVSDVRLKTNIAPISNALSKVKNINGVTFNMNDLAVSFGQTDTSKQVGVLAHEIEAVLPEAVGIAPFDREHEGDEIVSKSGENYKTVQYEKIVPLLIEAIKELSAKVEELEKRIASN
jgi:hypothetical protein